MMQNMQSRKDGRFVVVKTQNPRSTTVGLDLGDHWSRFCVLDGSGEIIEENRVRTIAAALEERFAAMSATRVVIEVVPGTSDLSCRDGFFVDSAKCYLSSRQYSLARSSTCC